MTGAEPILIAGGGIGGLSLALALARKAMASIVFERRRDLDESGAGIQIGPHGVHILRALGVADVLEPLVGVPEAIVVRNGRSGREVVRLPLGGHIERRHGAPYWVANRAALHTALATAARRSGLIDIRTGGGVVGFDEAADTVAVRIGGDAKTVRGAALIGADGIGSTVRAGLSPAAPPEPSRTSAARSVVATPVTGPFAEAVVTVWLSARCHIVHYPVDGGRNVSIVAFARDRASALAGDPSASGRDLVQRLGRLAPDLGDALAAVPDWRTWPVPGWQRPDFCARGRAALLGDAAHPIRPYLAQGAVMALEDGVVLADALAASADAPAALAAYGRQRRARVTRVAASSYANGLVYHLPGPLAAVRDGVMRRLGGDRILAGYDWLYGWRGIGCRAVEMRP